MNDPLAPRKSIVSRVFAVIPGVTFGVIALIIFFSFMQPRFMSWPNMMLIARHSSVLLVAAIGMTMVILVSQIDLSVGSVMSLSGAVAAYAMRAGWGFATAILLGLLCGVVVGFLNGIMVAVFKFDYWIATFGSMGIGAGLALVVARGETLAVPAATFGPAFGWIGNARVMLAPRTPLYFLPCIALTLIVIMWLVLRKTKFGYNIYSIGGSEQAARLSGLKVVRNRIYVYVCSGFFAAIAGLMLASMTNSASPIAGNDYSFDVIAAVIIGGTSFDGGRGGLFGTVMGALLVRTLASGLNLMNILPTWQKTIIGFAIVIIIVADVLSEKRKHRKELMRRYRDA